MTLRIAHLQPIVPHYREEFFALIGSRTEQDIYVYSDDRAARRDGFSVAQVRHKHIHTLRFLHDNVLIYNPFTLLRGHDVLVLMLHAGHVTTWLLLLTKWLHRRKIILWGQGISIARYEQEALRPRWVRRLMIALSDGCWIYMKPQARQWQAIFPKKPIAALGNTLSGVETMTRYVPRESIVQLKKRYGIQQETVLIFCARFIFEHRRTDLLLETIRRLDAKSYGFVIIGDGPCKPDFSPYDNVHDFGPLYDTAVKRELFALSDIYFQPGWVGLSIVEAMAYGKPVFTFRRSRETLQCVEYAYIVDGQNGRIFDSIDDCIATLNTITDVQIATMGDAARRLVASQLTMKQMVQRAMDVVEEVTKKDKSQG